MCVCNSNALWRKRIVSLSLLSEMNKAETEKDNEASSGIGYFKRACLHTYVHIYHIYTKNTCPHKYTYNINFF